LFDHVKSTIKKAASFLTQSLFETINEKGNITTKN